MSRAVVDAPWNWSELRLRCVTEARRVLGDAQHAEDAAQEALTRAWRKRHTCRSEDSRVPWVLQITRNEALRIRSRLGRQDLPQELPEIADATTGHDRSEETVIQKLDVTSALETLSSEDRLLLQLRYEADLAQAHIACLLGIPEGTIKVRLHRLRHRLRADLREDQG
jgi:RNA polymerase sigma-70 factor (ECF subfamily)